MRGEIKMILDYFMHLYLKYSHKRINYDDYLKTKHWKRIKYKTMKRADYKCQVCGTRKYSLEVHHNNYDNNLFWEKKSDLICVCAKCHRTIHYYIWNNIKKAS
jgi:5-methylcytosine-specific restriction endonuclease McrA